MTGLVLKEGIMSRLIPSITEQPIYKTIETWDALECMLTDLFINDGYVVAYTHYKVMIGKLYQGKLKFYENEVFNLKYLLKTRIFNEKKELLLWKNSENEEYEFQMRLRIDNEGEKIDVIDAEQVLWGTNYEVLCDGWTCLYEKRGTKIILPLDVRVTPRESVKIKTRNYIGRNNLGQAGYEDCRFVEFVYKGGQ